MDASTDRRIEKWLGIPVGFLLGGAIVLMTLAAYVPAIGGGFIWDDDAHVTRNPMLHDAGGLWRIWTQPGAVPQYYPLVFTTFWMEYHVWGLSPVGYHLLNVLLHAAGAVLVWRILRRLGAPGAWLAGAIFALHPVHVESVAWITERKNVLSGALYLGAMLAYLRFRPPEGDPPGASPDWRQYALSLALFVCALLSKTVTATLPVVILLAIWWKRGKCSRQDAAPLLPMLVLGLAGGLTTVLVEKHFIGAEGKEWSLSAIGRFLVAGRALWFYAGKLLVPGELAFIYPRWDVNAAAWWQYLLPAAAMAVIVSLWLLRQRVGRGALAGVLFFAVTLFPALGFFDVYPMQYSFVADHFQYLASLGLIALTAGLGHHFGAQLSRPGRRAAVVVAAGVLGLLFTLTWRQGRIYRDEETLWRDTIAKNPGCWMAHHNLGHIQLGQGKLDDALGSFRKTLQIKPDHAKAHAGLGLALLGEGEAQEAIGHFREAIRLDPGYASAHNNLGAALLDQGQVQEAIDCFRAAIRIAPEYSDALANLGNALLRKDQTDQAVECYLSALRINPDQANAHAGLGIVLLNRGKPAEAAGHLAEAIRLNPANAAAHYHLGKVLAGQGKTREAVEHWLTAIRHAPDYTDALNALGDALYLQGRIDPAVEFYQRSLRVNPDQAGPHAGIAGAWVQKGNLAEAGKHLAAAVRLEPNVAMTRYQLGTVLALQGRGAEAVREYRQAVNLDPNWTAPMNNLAWLLATSEDPNLRSGVEAVHLAEQVCKLTAFKDPSALDTLAAAYAEAGRFADAVTPAQDAIRFAEASGNQALAAAVQGRLRLYQSRTPYREKLTPTTGPGTAPSTRP